MLGVDKAASAMLDGAPHFDVEQEGKEEKP
jgi:hypothetical protein